MPTAKEQVKLDRNYEIYKTRKKFERMSTIMQRYLNGELPGIICHSFEMSRGNVAAIYREGVLLIQGSIEKGHFSEPPGMKVRDLLNKSVAQQNGATWGPIVKVLLAKVLERKIAAITEKYNNSPTPSRKNHELESKACARA